MSNEEKCRWIRRIESLNEIELAQMGDQFPLIRIDDTFAFDLTEWMEAEGWRLNTMPPLKKKERKNLTDSIRRFGVLEDVVIDPNDGWVADGNHRLQDYHHARAEGLDVPFAGFRVRVFADAEERDAFQASVSFAGRVPSTKLKRQAANRWIRRHPDWADNHIAGEIGIDQATVSAESDRMVADGEIEARPEMRLGRDGRMYPAPAPKQRRSAVEDPAAPLWTAWHAQRGGHATTSAEVMSIAEAEGIDLVQLGACRTDHHGTTRQKALTSWLSEYTGKRISDLILTAYRTKGGLTVFALVRPTDYRPNLTDEKEQTDGNA